MSCTSETVLLSRETNLRLLFGDRSMFSEAMFTSPLVDQLMKIYSVARSVSIYRLALGGTSFLTSQLSSQANQSLLKDCELQSQGVKTTENIHTNLESKTDGCDVTAEKLFSYGRTRIQQLIEENTPESLHESEFLKICKSALGLPQDNSLTSTGGISNISQNRDSISSAFWHVAEERWKDATDVLSQYTPEKMIHTAVQLAQDRINKIITNSSLVSQLSEAGDFLTTTTQSIKTETEILSQLLCEKREHALAGVSEFWNCYHDSQTTLGTLYNFINEYGHLACDGIELFSQYIWNTKPEFYEQDFLDANLQDIDDEEFYLMAEEPVQVRRRSILYIGAR